MDADGKFEIQNGHGSWNQATKLKYGRAGLNDGVAGKWTKKSAKSKKPKSKRNKTKE
jgi:hypothetical protein